MSTKIQAGVVEPVALGDWVITLALTGVMAGAYAMTLKWPSGTAFFPELLSLAGLFFCLLNLAALALQARVARVAVVPAMPEPSSSGEIALVEGDEDQGNEDEFHKVFNRADGRMWAASISWLALFFAGMYLFGLLVTLPIFTVLYLRVVAKSSWLTCLLYVLGTAGLIYALFVFFLHLPLPTGIFPIFGE